MPTGKYNTWTELGILLAMTGLGFILGGVLQMLILQAYLPDNTSAASMDREWMKLLSDPRHANLARISQALGSISIFIIPSFLFIFITKGFRGIHFGFSGKLTIIQLGAAILLLFCASLVTAPIDHAIGLWLKSNPSLGKWAGNLEDTYNQNVQMMGSFHSPLDWVVTIGLMALLPAVAEEIFFRSVIQQSFSRWWGNSIAAILATAVVFSMIHFSILLFAGRAVLGIVLGLIFHFTGNIWINIAAHFFNNLIAVIQLYYLRMENKPYQPTSFHPPYDYWYAILALACLIFIFSRLRYISAPLKAEILSERERADSLFTEK